MVAPATRVKVCGLTSLHDAELAVELGAWAVGLIFFEDSPRRCSLAEAQRITSALRRKAELCGVFVNAPLEQVAATGQELGLTMLQLHGDEGPAFCAEAARRSGARVIKAAQVSGPGDIRDLERFHVDFHLLDARARAPERRALRGGTGETFDWTLIAGRRSKVPLILGGGLNAANVADAIALAKPYAVDTASGTESAPGRKDAEEMSRFFDAARGANRDGAPAEDGAPAFTRPDRTAERTAHDDGEIGHEEGPSAEERHALDGKAWPPSATGAARRPTAGQVADTPA